jgi:pseudouridine synthase
MLPLRSAAARGAKAVSRHYHRPHVTSFSTRVIRLSKRMSELDLCSRREADRLIASGRVLVGGRPVEPALGQKVDPDERDIAILATPLSPDGVVIDQLDKAEGDSNVNNIIRPLEFDWERMRGDTVVLHKPPGYVSGQPEDSVIGGRGRHEPAVRLLTRKNLYIQGGIAEDRELKETLSHGNYLHFSRKWHQRQQQTQGGDSWWNDRSDNRRSKGSDNCKGTSRAMPPQQDATLTNYVPSGRLDLESTGLLIFTKNGVMAKKLISPQGLVEKEYVVEVSPAQSLTRVEREMGMEWLPDPTKDLRPLLRGGAKLFGEHRALRPVVEAEWIDHNKGGGGTLRIVLREGMKRHLRRACRELLGLHVDNLVRTRIADVKLDIPEGRWRPLREHEARSIFFAGVEHSSFI